MSANIADKIPDIYFDWFARFLPGAVGVFAFFYLSPISPEVSALHLFAYAFAAYVFGHLIQPVSSLAIDFLQKMITSDTQETAYSQAKADSSKETLCAKVSKAHAESVGMFSSALAVFLVCIYLDYSSIPFIFLVGYFLAAAVERAYARRRKIIDIG